MSDKLSDTLRRIVEVCRDSGYGPANVGLDSMTTALDIANARADKLRSVDPCWIPPITDPRGACWDQPDRSEILLDGKYAVMSHATFDKLADYSCSQPSGVYVGKMWKSGWPYLHDKSAPRTWTLCWFGEHENPNYVSNNYREILLVD